MKWLTAIWHFLIADFRKTDQRTAAKIEEAEARRHGSVISTRPLPLDIERPGAWNRHFRRAVHYWRYGYLHPDEDLLGVIDAVGDALNVQIAAVRAVLSGEAAREAASIKEELDTELKKKLPDFSVLLGIEARINALYPPEMSRRRQWVLRERFERVAAPEAYQHWFQNWFQNPPTDDSGRSDERLLAAAEEQLLEGRLRHDHAKAAVEHTKEQVREAQRAVSSIERRIISEAPDISLPALRQRLASGEPVAELSSDLVEELRRADETLARGQGELDQAKAELAKEAAAAAQAEARYKAAEARWAVARACAEVARKIRKVEQARTRVDQEPVGSKRHEEAAAALLAAEAELEAAQRVLKERKATAASGHVDPDDGGFEQAGTGDQLSEAKADSQTLLSYIHTSYLMTINREKTVRDLKRWLLMRFWWFLIRLVPILVGIWLLLWWTENAQYWPIVFGLVLIAAAGRAGATTSIIRRLQNAVSDRVLASDPIVELTALRTGKNEISLALMSSSIFALLLYAFFLSGVPDMVGMRGGIFPRPISTAERTEEKSADAAASKPEAAAPDNSSIGMETDDTPTRPASDDADDATAPGTDPRLLEASAPRPYAHLRRAQAAADRALEAYRSASAAHLDLDWWAWMDRINSNARMHRAVETALAAQREALMAANAGLDEARRGGDENAIRAWEREADGSRTWSGHLQDWDNYLEGRGPPKPGLTCATGANCNPFPQLATALGLTAASDFFKLLLWAFIAGFAERFVPDVLDRIVSQTRGASGRSNVVLAPQARTVNDSSTSEGSPRAVPATLDRETAARAPPSG